MVYKFQFDTKKAKDLREAINDREKFSIERDANGSNEKNGPKGVYNAWNRLCATMTRLEDTIDYINKMELGKLGDGQAAFDFYEFINCAYVVIECIKVVVRIFDLDDDLIERIEKSTDVFGLKYSLTGNDSRFFEYIRSLCGVHPLCTSRQTEYLNASNFHCCPFVAWTDRGYVSSKRYDGADLIAHLYATNSNNPINIKLYINEFEKYLGKWIDCIQSVIEAKNKYVDDKYELLRADKMKRLSDFNDDYIKYIGFLREEYVKRLDYGLEYILDEYIEIFKIKLTNDNNQRKLEKYKNAIVYSLGFFHNSLQNMSFEGYENTGLQYPERNVETELYIELHSSSVFGSAFEKHSYAIQKIYNLMMDNESSIFEKDYARRLLEEPKELINKYVHFTNYESDTEAYVLVKLAVYLESLTRRSTINKNIPNDSIYRENILTQTEIDELHTEEAKRPSLITMDSPVIKELLEKYGR